MSHRTAAERQTDTEVSHETRHHPDGRRGRHVALGQGGGERHQEGPRLALQHRASGARRGAGPGIRRSRSGDRAGQHLRRQRPRRQAILDLHCPRGGIRRRPRRQGSAPRNGCEGRPVRRTSDRPHGALRGSDRGGSRGDLLRDARRRSQGRAGHHPSADLHGSGHAAGGGDGGEEIRHSGILLPDLRAARQDHDGQLGGGHDRGAGRGRRLRELSGHRERRSHRASAGGASAEGPVVDYVGGCCGSDPSYIRELAARMGK